MAYLRNPLSHKWPRKRRELFVTYLHLWDPEFLRYPWLDDNALLNRALLPADYRWACGSVQVEKMVFVQCEAEFSQFQEETDWVTGLAKGEEPRIAGIVPWAPLELGDEARPALEKLARNGLVKGIRRIIQFEPDPEFCLRPGFVRGVQALSDYGLHFEICIVHTQMANTIKLVEQCPNVTFILDHIGKPGIKDHIMDPWRQDLKTLAGFPNMWCKVSGLVTEADHKQWTKEDLRPYLDHVFDIFGFERAMYGGDWPVAWQATEYPRWVETLTWAIAGCSAEESRKLFHDNAMDFYRLREPGKGGARD